MATEIPEMPLFIMHQSLRQFVSIHQHELKKISKLEKPACFSICALPISTSLMRLEFAAFQRIHEFFYVMQSRYQADYIPVA